MEQENELHVVFGSGALGLGVTRILLAEGKRVRIVNRSGKAQIAGEAEIMAGDATDASRTREICQGATVVYNCANAPYTDWPALFPPIQRGIIAGAAAANARLVVAENLYMYGEVDGPLTEDLPHAATTRKGRVRAQMAEELMEAHRKGIVRSVAARGSDFYGPYAREQGIFGDRALQLLLAGKRVSMVGNLDMPRTYTYTEDFARGLVILGAHEEAYGQAWHIPNAPTLTTRELLSMFFAEAGLPPKMSGIPGGIIKLLGYVNPLIREVGEMLYEFNKPFIVDSSKFVRAFGDIATPHRQAVCQTLAWFRAQFAIRAAA
ncbi:MAG TPA: NAD-dependent epimerase/dehydratase family protein [Ktedonobacteraceae bacterium]